MQCPIIKYISTFLFLVAFLVPRMVDLHAIEHLSEDDDAISCELCDISSNSVQFDLFFTNTVYDNATACILPSSFIAIRYYNSPIAKIVTPTWVYNKPPPIS